MHANGITRVGNGKSTPRRVIATVRQQFIMRLPRSTVLWFYVFTHVLKAIGEGINLSVVNRLTVSGAPLTNSPVSAWRPYGFYVTPIGPSLVGLLMTLSLYGLPGVRRLAAQRIGFFPKAIRVKAPRVRLSKGLPAL